MIIEKLKEDKGSAMILAILAIGILSIFIVLISKQISEQLVSTKKRESEIQMKYIAEAGVEEIIANAIKSIKIKSGNIEYNSGDIKIENPIVLNINDKVDIKTEINLTKGELNRDNNNINLSITSVAGKFVNNSAVDEYKIKADVEIIVSNIKSDIDFDISYNIKTWDKKE